MKPFMLCKDCGREFSIYMVTDQVWRDAGLWGDENCCIPCLALRLDRPMVRKDFMNARCNVVIRADGVAAHLAMTDEQISDRMYPPLPACVACNGWGSIRSQHSGGEVREYMCVRCMGSGDEPRGFWNRLEAFFSVQPFDEGHVIVLNLTEKPNRVNRDPYRKPTV